MSNVHEGVMRSTDPEDQISLIYMVGDQRMIVLRDGTMLELSDADVEMLELSFDSECENCGFDPNADPSEEEDDGEEDEEEDQRVQ